MFQNGVGNARGIVMRFDLVMAQTCYPALIVGLLPRSFGENTPLFETLVGHVRLVAIAVATTLMTRDVDIVQIIQTGLQVELVPIESGFQTACIGIAFRVVGIFNLLAGRIVDGTQAVCVHHVVDFAFTVAQFQLAEPWCEVALGKTDIPRITVEFAAVHHAVGVGNLGLAALVCAGNGGVFCRGNTQLQHLAVAFEVRVNAVAVAVFVVIGFVMGDIGTDVSVFAAELGLQRAIKAVVAACCQGGIDVVRFFSEIRVFTDKLHRAADQTHTLGNGLRAFSNHDFIK